MTFLNISLDYSVMTKYSSDRQKIDIFGYPLQLSLAQRYSEIEIRDCAHYVLSEGLCNGVYLKFIAFVVFEI